MRCPTCDKTLEQVHYGKTGICHFHCPCCGTWVATDASMRVEKHVPSLVERCRAFEQALHDAHPMDLGTITQLRQEWHSIGIHEAINLPAERSAMPE
jgi:hypothetical protein